MGRLGAGCLETGCPGPRRLGLGRLGTRAPGTGSSTTSATQGRGPPLRDPAPPRAPAPPAPSRGEGERGRRRDPRGSGGRRAQGPKSGEERTTDGLKDLSGCGGQRGWRRGPRKGTSRLPPTSSPVVPTVPTWPSRQGPHGKLRKTRCRGQRPVRTARFRGGRRDWDQGVDDQDAGAPRERRQGGRGRCGGGKDPHLFGVGLGDGRGSPCESPCKRGRSEGDLGVVWTETPGSWSRARGGEGGGR